MVKQKKDKSEYLEIYSFAESWVKLQFKWFASDDLKDAYYSSGGKTPNNLNVFGAVFRVLSKNKLIFPFGFTTSRNKVARGRILKTWISLEFKQRQANNASNKSTLKLEL